MILRILEVGAEKVLWRRYFIFILLQLCYLNYYYSSLFDLSFHHSLISASQINPTPHISLLIVYVF